MVNTVLLLAQDASSVPSHVTLSAPSPDRSLMKAPPRKTHTSENCVAMARVADGREQADEDAPHIALDGDEEDHPTGEHQPLKERYQIPPEVRRARLSDGEENEHPYERHPNRPYQQEEVRDVFDLIILLRVVIAAAHDTQVFVEKVPRVEDALGDRWAEYKGNEEVERRGNDKRVSQPAAARAKAASAAIAKKGYNAQRDGDEQHNGQERAQQQAEAEADRNALAGKEPSIPVDGGPREERDGILVELACGARQLDILASRHEVQLPDARHHPLHLGDQPVQPLAAKLTAKPREPQQYEQPAEDAQWQIKPLVDLPRVLIVACVGSVSHLWALDALHGGLVVEIVVGGAAHLAQRARVARLAVAAAHVPRLQLVFVAGVGTARTRAVAVR
eukprot:scaffold72363_cov60-Phaeocystis_antarctica.AAC.5